MTPQEIITIIVQYGLPTVLLFGMAWFHVKEKKAWDIERKELYARVTDETRLRVDDAKIGFGVLRDMQVKVTDSVGKLSDVAETRELVRELIDTVTKASTIIETLEKSQSAPRSRGPLR